MEGEERDRFYDSAAGVTAHLSVEAQGAIYLVRVRDQNVGRSLFVKQGRGEMRVLERAVRLIAHAAGEDAVVGRQFLDVGANVGTSTIPALTRHRFGSAICFEPEPQNLLTLRVNLLLNGLQDRAQTLGVAVSNATGTADLMVDPEQGGKGWIAARKEMLEWAIGDTAPISVSTVTLDDLTADGLIDPENVGLLWVDAQAHEGHIIAGAGQLTEGGVPIVLEWFPNELDRLGNRQAIEDVAASQYTHFLDLRRNPDPTEPDYELRRGAALGDFAHNFDDTAGRRFTDILLLRLEPAVANRLHVGEILDGSSPSSADDQPPPSANGMATRDKPDKAAYDEAARAKPAQRARPAVPTTTTQAPKTRAAKERRRRQQRTKQVASSRRAKQELVPGQGQPLDSDERRARKRSPEAEALRRAKEALRTGPGSGAKKRPQRRRKPSGGSQ